MGFVLVLSLVRSSTSARNIPTDQTVGLSDQKTFLPCFPRKINSNNGVVGVPNDGNEETVLHANAPVEAESPGASTGLKDEKNFIYGGVGGFGGDMMDPWSSRKSFFPPFSATLFRAVAAPLIVTL